jgi:glycosyltransferase involved in cell wall biosynthesis
MISVFIPYLNGSAYIEEALQSLEAQTFKDFHVVVYDSGSTQEEQRFLCEALKILKRPIEYGAIFSSEQFDMIENWNRCLKHAAELPKTNPAKYGPNDWVKFLHQDDLLEPTYFERLKSHASDIVANRRDFLFANDTEENTRQAYIDQASYMVGRSKSAREFIRHLVVAPGYNAIGEPSSVAFRRRCIERFGLFHVKLFQMADWEYFARIAAHTGIEWIDESLSVFRVHKDSASFSADRQAEAPVLIDAIFEILKRLNHQHGQSSRHHYSAARSPA